MNAAEDLETREGRKLHFKKEFGRSMSLKNRPSENLGSKTTKIGELSKSILSNTKPQRRNMNPGALT